MTPPIMTLEETIAWVKRQVAITGNIEFASALRHLEAGKALALLTERKPEHPINESEEPPLRTFVTGDNSVCLRVRDDVAYDIYPNGELVVIRKRGEVTYFHEWTVDDLTEIKDSPQPSQQEGQ